MTELLAIMWKQLTHNTALAFFAVLLISGSNSFVAYQSSKTNVNIEAITKAMEDNTAEVVKVSERSEENSKKIAETQEGMLELQAKLFSKDWEQDKIIAEMYRNVLIQEAKREKSK